MGAGGGPGRPHAKIVGQGGGAIGAQSYVIPQRVGVVRIFDPDTMPIVPGSQDIPPGGNARADLCPVTAISQPDTGVVAPVQEACGVHSYVIVCNGGAGGPIEVGTRATRGADNVWQIVRNANHAAIYIKHIDSPGVANGSGPIDSYANVVARNGGIVGGVGDPDPKTIAPDDISSICGPITDHRTGGAPVDVNSGMVGGTGSVPRNIGAEVIGINAIVYGARPIDQQGGPACIQKTLHMQMLNHTVGRLDFNTTVIGTTGLDGYVRCAITIYVTFYGGPVTVARGNHHNGIEADGHPYKGGVEYDGIRPGIGIGIDNRLPQRSRAGIIDTGDGNLSIRFERNDGQEHPSGVIF